MANSQTLECSVLNFEKLRIEIYLSFEFSNFLYNINFLLP